MKNNKFKIQEKQYEFPYHYLVSFENYSTSKSLSWGCEYYSYMKETLNEISKIKFSSLLDVGCGEGRLLNLLSKKFPNRNFKGIDLSEPSILLAKGLNYGKPNLLFELEDVNKVTETFDVVVLNEVLEHIPDDSYSSFCDSIKKIIKKNGYLVITVPTKITPVQDKHFRHYDINMIEEKFSDFSKLKQKYIFKNSYLGKIIKGISHRSLIPKSFEKILVERLLLKANKNSGKHLLVIFKKT